MLNSSGADLRESISVSRSAVLGGEVSIYKTCSIISHGLAAHQFGDVESSKSQLKQNHGGFPLISIKNL